MGRVIVQGANIFSTLNHVTDQIFSVATESAALELAESIALDIRQKILSQPTMWPPLTDKYLDRKRRQGLDPRTLISTGYYIRSIRARFGYGNEVIVSTGGLFTESGFPLESLAIVHEYGTWDGKIPARPHWRPVIADYLENLKAISSLLGTHIWSQVSPNLQHVFNLQNRRIKQVQTTVAVRPSGVGPFPTSLLPKKQRKATKKIKSPKLIPGRIP